MWGQAEQRVNAVQSLGIIPTRVGTRNSNFAVLHKGEDHPHACGDKFCRLKNIYHFVGSSPRVWGQVGVVDYFFKHSGIIPTRVGTSYDPNNEFDEE